MRDIHQLPPEVAPDRGSGEPLYRQIYRNLRAAILSGRLEAGTRLPSTRAAASELGVGRNTVVAVFEQLADEGFVSSRVGAGTLVAEVDAQVIRRSLQSNRQDAGGRSDSSTAAGPGALSERGMMLSGVPRGSFAHGAFQTGLPDIAAFPHRTWARIVARHARSPEAERLGYADAAGDPRLRSAIAGYVAAARGVGCSPERVIVVTGAQAALDLASRLLLDPGDHAWLEEPGYLGARAALVAAGARIEPVPVDAQGMDVEAGEARCSRRSIGLRHAFVPVPHWGRRWSLERRLLLLDWAERAGAFVIEDDYDSEYRYRGRPIASVQGLDPHGRVVYVGTFAKTMLPALRVGYLIVPEGLQTAFASAVRNTGQTASQPVQGALAEFIDAGHYGAHVRRMRHRYGTAPGVAVRAPARRIWPARSSRCLRTRACRSRAGSPTAWTTAPSPQQAAAPASPCGPSPPTGWDPARGRACTSGTLPFRRMSWNRPCTALRASSGRRRHDLDRTERAAENALVCRNTRCRALQDAPTPPMTEGNRVASIGR